ncbi:hypothetical protein DI487_13860 [Flavobacterium sediminis]|uniref:Uncharacterized protein n=2 Tax=Flavobacterium sediminis TaxID=2201181 RepID=A0A2U8QXJ7_9FLAO|nr:hypothetical protein DI487_13860 [Flavobacterium sediminis]
MEKQNKKTLIWANIIMIVMIVIHDTDHVRQASCWDYTIPLSVWLVNISVYTPSLIALFLISKNKNSAAIATVINGLLVAAAFAEVHLWRPTFPVWGIWNSNFFKLGADSISWTVLAVTIFVGVGVSLTGNYVRGRISVMEKLNHE